MISGVVAVEDDGAQGARRLMGVHNEGLHYANSRAVDLYLITLTGRSFIWISHPRECARVQLMLGWFLLPFYKGGELLQRVFFPLLLLLLPPPPPAPSFFVSLAASMLPSPRVRINSYNYITRWRDHYSWQTFLFSPFSFSIPPSCFLFQKTTTKSSFPRGRLTLGSNREGWDLEGRCAPVPPQTGAVVQSRFVTTRLHARWYCGCLSGARIFRYTWKYVGERVNRAA